MSFSVTKICSNCGVGLATSSHSWCQHCFSAQQARQSSHSHYSSIPMMRTPMPSMGVPSAVIFAPAPAVMVRPRCSKCSNTAVSGYTLCSSCYANHKVQKAMKSQKQCIHMCGRFATSGHSECSICYSARKASSRTNMCNRCGIHAASSSKSRCASCLKNFGLHG